MTVGVGRRLRSLDIAVTVSDWLSFAPAVMPASCTVARPEFALTIRSGIVFSVGGSLTEFTVRTNVLLVTRPLVSVTLTLIGAAPKRLVAGRIVSTRFELVPLKVNAD